jgi:hypothetical protein
MMALLLRILLLATILSGECGEIRGACRLSMAQTIANRGSVQGFFARGEPGVEDMAIGFSLATGRVRRQANGFMFAYSDHDRQVLGWRAGDLRVCQPEVNLCVNFTREWPGG